MPWQHAPGTTADGGFVPVELAQTGPREFTLRADLVHRLRSDSPLLRAGRTPGGAPSGAAPVDPVHVVPAGFRTDLASVPFPLWALIGPFGRHTRAAIVHDHGVRTLPSPRRSAAVLALRERVDLRFRDALLDSDVPRLRAWLLWAGTSLDRVVRHAQVPLAAALVLQLAAGLVCLAVALRVGGWPGAGLAALPVLPALAWGRLRVAVLLAQYVGALVLPALVLNAATSVVLAGLGAFAGDRRPGIAPTRLPDGPADRSG
jgi:hypothetical protein